MTYQQCTRFWTTLGLDREYLWNGPSYRQAENGVINRDDSDVRQKQFGELWSTNKSDFNLWSIILKFTIVHLEVVEVHVPAKCHQAECSCSWVTVCTNFLPYLTMVMNPKIRSSDLDLWPMTLKFCGFRAFVKVHDHAKLNQAKCSGSWVIVRTEKKAMPKTILSVATEDSKYSDIHMYIYIAVNMTKCD